MSSVLFCCSLVGRGNCVSSCFDDSFLYNILLPSNTSSIFPDKNEIKNNFLEQASKHEKIDDSLSESSLISSKRSLSSEVCPFTSRLLHASFAMKLNDEVQEKVAQMPEIRSENEATVEEEKNLEIRNSSASDRNKMMISQEIDVGISLKNNFFEFEFFAYCPNSSDSTSIIPDHSSLSQLLSVKKGKAGGVCTAKKHGDHLIVNDDMNVLMFNGCIFYFNEEVSEGERIKEKKTVEDSEELKVENNKNKEVQKLEGKSEAKHSTETNVKILYERLNKCENEKEVNKVFSFAEGMFCFVFFFAKQKKLFFGKDKCGSKSLLFFYTKNGFCLSSFAPLVFFERKRQISCLKAEVDSYNKINNSIQSSINECADSFLLENSPVEIPTNGFFLVQFFIQLQSLNKCTSSSPVGILPFQQNPVQPPSLTSFLSSLLFISYVVPSSYPSCTNTSSYTLRARKNIIQLRVKTIKWLTPLPFRTKNFYEVLPNTLSFLKKNKIDLNFFQKLIFSFYEVLTFSVHKRIKDILKNNNAKEKPSVGILFSGGLDSAVLANLTLSLVETNCCVELLNVAFDVGAPDRMQALISYEELLKIFPKHDIRLICIDVTLDDLLNEDEKIKNALFPKRTHLDYNIGAALYFASQGCGYLCSPDFFKTSRWIRSKQLYLESIVAKIVRNLNKKEKSKQHENKQNNISSNAEKKQKQTCKFCNLKMKVGCANEACKLCCNIICQVFSNVQNKSKDFSNIVDGIYTAKNCADGKDEISYENKDKTLRGECSETFLLKSNKKSLIPSKGKRFTCLMKVMEECIHEKRLNKTKHLLNLNQTDEFHTNFVDANNISVSNPYYGENKSLSTLSIFCDVHKCKKYNNCQKKVKNGKNCCSQISKHFEHLHTDKDCLFATSLSCINHMYCTTGKKMNTLSEIVSNNFINNQKYIDKNEQILKEKDHCEDISHFKNTSRKEDESMCAKQKLYTSKSSVLLIGSGIDELLGGYYRCNTAAKFDLFAVRNEVIKDLSELWIRNMGRDDRCVKVNRKECRIPFLDSQVLRFLSSYPLNLIVQHKDLANALHNFYFNFYAGEDDLRSNKHNENHNNNIIAECCVSDSENSILVNSEECCSKLSNSNTKKNRNDNNKDSRCCLTSKDDHSCKIGKSIFVYDTNEENEKKSSYSCEDVRVNSSDFNKEQRESYSYDHCNMMKKNQKNGDNYSNGKDLFWMVQSECDILENTSVLSPLGEKQKLTTNDFERAKKAVFEEANSKWMLRSVSKLVGMKNAAFFFKKKAIQFGSRIAKKSNATHFTSFRKVNANVDYF